VTLLQHPEQLQEMIADPSLVPSAVEELLRYHTASALATRRVATQDVEVAGQVTRQLSLLELCLISYTS
jgi:fungal nitric oxide reductase